MKKAKRMFVSYNIDYKNGNVGFGSATISYMKIRNDNDVRVIERAILNDNTNNAKNIILLNWRKYR